MIPASATDKRKAKRTLEKSFSSTWHSDMGNVVQLGKRFAKVTTFKESFLVVLLLSIWSEAERRARIYQECSLSTANSDLVSIASLHQVCSFLELKK